jgi:hypothetical protein
MTEQTPAPETAAGTTPNDAKKYYGDIAVNIFGALLLVLATGYILLLWLAGGFDEYGVRYVMIVVISIVAVALWGISRCIADTIRGSIKLSIALRDEHDRQTNQLK